MLAAPRLARAARTQADSLTERRPSAGSDTPSSPTESMAPAAAAAAGVVTVPAAGSQLWLFNRDRARRGPDCVAQAQRRCGPDLPVQVGHCCQSLGSQLVPSRDDLSDII